MPDGKDPADLLAGGGDAPERFREALQGAVDVPVFEVRAILADADLSSPMGRDRALDEAVPVLSAMPDSITRDELVREVADRLDADPALVLRRMAGGARPPSQASPEGGERDGAGATETRRPAARLSPRERRERALLAMCVAMPARGREILDEITPEHLMPATARAARWLAEHFDDPLADLPRDDDEMVSVVNWAVVRSEQAPSDPEAIELSYLQVQQAMLERQIAAAEEGGGDPPVELQRRRAEIAERIAHRQVASRPRS
jgi:DNA primase